MPIYRARITNYHHQTLSIFLPTPKVTLKILPNTVYISSDSSSVTEILMSSDSSSKASGWESYFPPCASSSSSKKSIKKTATPAPSLEFYSISSDDDETYTLSKELPKALSQALNSAISNLKKIPVPEKPARLPKPPKQVFFFLLVQDCSQPFRTKRKVLKRPSTTIMERERSQWSS